MGRAGVFLKYSANARLTAIAIIRSFFYGLLRLAVTRIISMVGCATSAQTIGEFCRSALSILNAWLLNVPFLRFTFSIPLSYSKIVRQTAVNYLASDEPLTRVARWFLYNFKFCKAMWELYAALLLFEHGPHCLLLLQLEFGYSILQTHNPRSPQVSGPVPWVKMVVKKREKK